MGPDLLRLRRDADDFEGSLLERDLRAHVDGEIGFDRGTRGLYATDASNYRVPPIGVVIPRDTEGALAALEVCREHDVPVLPRGGGTSLAGQCCNRAIVIDCSRHLRRIEIDPQRAVARVQPGVVLDDLRAAAAPHGLTFGPDPATHDRCTLGGMLGNNSCGVHSVLSEFYGPGPRTSDQVESLDVTTYDGTRLHAAATSAAELERYRSTPGRVGQIYRDLLQLRERSRELIRRSFPRIPRRVSGFNLPALLEEGGFHVGQALVGSEGTCAFIVDATVKLIPARPKRILVVIGFPDLFSAADAVAEVRRHEPVACEGIDDRLVDHVKKLGWDTSVLDLLPRGSSWLLVEHGAGTLAEARSAAERTRRAFADSGNVRIYEEEAQRKKVWDLRESGLAVTAFVPGGPDSWPGWEDAAVPPDALGAYLREFADLLARHGLAGALYGHFGQGCVHTRIDFDFHDRAGIGVFRRFTAEAARLVTKYGGSISGEHGDGQARGDLLGVMYGPEIVARFAEFKAIWDPTNRMNPGKVVAPASRTADLRLRAFDPQREDIRLHQAKDGYDFAHAATRCVGVGLCRKTEGGTMCPSYMVTRDERHSTRGRAHLLFEMMRGDVVTDGWQSDEVHEALDLCLNCKACKAECPVNVDMASYKAEFMSHYYEGKSRPRDAHVIGRIHAWSGMGARMPRLANLFTSLPGVSGLGKKLAGLAPERDAPRFAPKSFRRGFRKRPNGGQRVILWPDTFNDAFYPEILHAAAEVLTRAGYEVDIPARRLCCGRPMIEYGWLDRVRAEWLRILDVLADEIAAGVPVVGIEPSCTVFFRDELLALLPRDPRAKRLSELTYSLGELLGMSRTYAPPEAEGRIAFHFHCQQRAVLGHEAEPSALRALGYEVNVLDDGCCGMAGAFGFKANTYSLSIALADRVLLPTLRELPEEVLVVTDGFSCREQIRQLGGVRAVHTAEVIERAGRT